MSFSALLPLSLQSTTFVVFPIAHFCISCTYSLLHRFFLAFLNPSVHVPG